MKNENDIFWFIVKRVDRCVGNSALFFQPLHVVLLGLLLSPLVAFLLPLVVLKLLTGLFITLLLFCGKVSHLIYVTLLITSLLRLTFRLYKSPAFHTVIRIASSRYHLVF